MKAIFLIILANIMFATSNGKTGSSVIPFIKTPIPWSALLCYTCNSVEGNYDNCIRSSTQCNPNQDACLSTVLYKSNVLSTLLAWWIMWIMCLFSTDILDSVHWTKGFRLQGLLNEVTVCLYATRHPGTLHLRHGPRLGLYRVLHDR